LVETALIFVECDVWYKILLEKVDGVAAAKSDALGGWEAESFLVFGFWFLASWAC
jgi:hypothetical protein